MPVHYWYFLLVLVTWSPKVGITNVQYKTEFWVSKAQCEARRAEAIRSVLRVIAEDQRLTSPGPCKQIKIRGLEI